MYNQKQNEKLSYFKNKMSTTLNLQFSEEDYEHDIVNKKLYSKKKYPYNPGRIFEFYLDDIILDWDDPSMALLIKPRSINRKQGFIPYYFMLDHVIKWEDRNKEHKIIFRTFKDPSEKELNDDISIQPILKYSFIKSSSFKTDKVLDRTDRMKGCIYDPNDLKVLYFMIHECDYIF